MFNAMKNMLAHDKILNTIQNKLFRKNKQVENGFKLLLKKTTGH